MDAISYKDARANLSKTMEQVCNDHAPVIITRKRKSPVIMLSLEDYQAMEETKHHTCFTHLLIPETYLESIVKLVIGKGIARALIHSFGTLPLERY